mgnify:FL=1
MRHMKLPTARYRISDEEIAVIGGGPAGMMAAVSAAANGARVLLLEKNDRLGIKLCITGKGRCNITNSCTPQTVIQNTPRNGKFLYSSLNRFSPSDVYEFFERNGLKLKVERGNRVFPVSDRAKDVLEVLKNLLSRNGVKVMRFKVNDIVVNDDGSFDILSDSGQAIRCKAVILATGGKSYPKTGSTGDGYRLAERLGHTVIEPKPSIVPLESPDPDCVEMQGLSLRNVGVRATDKNGRLVYEDFGELMFTHFGISGPTVLSMSAHLRDFDKTGYTVSIDFKPALDHKKLDERILRDFEKFSNRIFRNSLGDLLPAKAIMPVVRRSGIDPFKPVHSIERKERQTLLSVIKDFRIEISGTRPIEEAVVTSGGVDTGEIDPRTMESKLVRGLFFAGEIIDVDAYTGGFNLQIAWSTGYSAGLSASKYCDTSEDWQC